MTLSRVNDVSTVSDGFFHLAIHIHLLQTSESPGRKSLVFATFNLMDNPRQPIEPYLKGPRLSTLT